ncbi:MAG: DUF5000 domain-containing lipoprotein [Mangrovibacterium sp.]
MNKTVMLNKKRPALAALLLILALVSCKEAPIGQEPTDDIPPAPLTGVQITPAYGGARISYNLPAEEDISYVKCEFEYKGEKHTVNSSVYKSYLDIEGLGDTSEIQAKLSVIDHSENASEPYAASFVPLAPPMAAILESFTVTPTYGGIKVAWENPAGIVAGISFLAANDKGELELQDIYYTSAATGTKSLRGFNTNKRLFALSIVDKYENNSDTFKVEIEPLYEAELDKSKFADGHLKGDNFSVNNNRPLSYIWDGTIDKIWHTLADGGYSIPQFFTVDLGDKMALSRFVEWERNGQYSYAQHNLRIFDVYGTDELTHPADDPYYANIDEWTKDWHLLAKCEVIKPSGSAMGTNTAEDLAAEEAGFNFDFDESAPKIRYLRFVVWETWAKTPAMHVAEISVFGDDRVAQ